MEKKGIFLIYCSGVYNLLFAAFHIMFWWIPFFNWGEELSRLSGLNSGVMQVLNLCLIALFLLIAFISFVHARDLLMTSLGRTILSGLAIFWLLRLIEQFLFWKRAGALLPVLFVLGILLYLVPVVLSMKLRKNWRGMPGVP